MNIKFFKKIVSKIPYSKIIYLNLKRLLNGKLFTYSYLHKKSISITKFSVKHHHIFFGYYDINPFDKNKSKLLAIKTRSDLKAPAEIGFFYLNNPNKFLSLGTTKSWCWQQGARLRWYYQNNKKLISYNDFINGKYVNIIKNIENKVIEKLIPFPLYDISADRKTGLSLNFSRLQRLRPGYGYSNIEDFSLVNKCPDNDGIYLVNINTNKSKLIISYSNLIKEFPLIQKYKNTHHYFNHLSFNPSGNKFLFFHLMQHENGRNNRLFVFDVNSKKISLLEDDLTVSHYTWRDDNNILITAVDKKVNKTYYIIYSTEKNKKKVLNHKYLNKDGHPTFLNDKSIISDTYPDVNNNQDLFYYNIDKDRYIKLGSFYRRYKYNGETRCDLHPRISNDSKYISIDSTHSGLRSQFVLKFKI